MLVKRGSSKLDVNVWEHKIGCQTSGAQNWVPMSGSTKLGVNEQLYLDLPACLSLLTVARIIVRWALRGVKGRS
eukprot:1158354-Pelagomonas_calceolata.AAC.4